MSVKGFLAMATAALVIAGTQSAFAQAPAQAPKAGDAGASPPAAAGSVAPSGAKARAGKGAGPLAACQNEFMELCAGAEHGGGNRMRCLRSNEAKLSPGCKAAFDAVREARAAKAGANKAGDPAAAGKKAAGKGLQQACKMERETYCGTVQAGGGRVMKCLRDNKSKLSADCEQALAAKGGGQRFGKGPLPAPKDQPAGSAMPAPPAAATPPPAATGGAPSAR